MSGRRAIGVFFALILVVAPAWAGADRFPDREATYPAEVANVTHAPWQPAKGEDVVVRLTLREGTEPPVGVTLLHCRVEPSYACGMPIALRPDGTRSWRGTIEWDRRFMAEAQHIGYNLTLRFGEGETVRDVTAPRGDHWVPATYPPDTGASYFFYTLSPATNEAPGAMLPPVLALLALMAFLGGVSRRPRAR